MLPSRQRVSHIVLFFFYIQEQCHPMLTWPPPRVEMKLRFWRRHPLLSAPMSLLCCPKHLLTPYPSATSSCQSRFYPSTHPLHLKHIIAGAMTSRLHPTSLFITAECENILTFDFKCVLSAGSEHVMGSLCSCNTI